MMKRKTALLLATWFGSGLAPKASGTFGSLAALPFIFAVIYFTGLTGLLIFTGLIFILGLAASSKVLTFTRPDPPLIVIDEVAGQAFTFIFIANYIMGSATDLIFFFYALGFGFFRLFDILKPYPVSWADTKVNGALGVMLDDILAGLYASLCLFATVWSLEKFVF